MLSKSQIAQRIAQELQNGWYVNLGIGIPTLVANYIPEGIDVEFQSENGILGMGPFPVEGTEDADLINAGKQTITALPGAVFFDSATSFAMIRGQHVQLTVLGAMEVSQNGDIGASLPPRCRHRIALQSYCIAIALPCNCIALQSHCSAIALHCNRIVLQSHCIALL